MKNLAHYICLILTLVLATSFQSRLVEEKAREFTVNGLKVILKPSVKEIISARFFIHGGTANYSKALEGVESLA
ncbi:MAG TPA: hypothetical protein VFD46_03270, partial [Chryseolinea sp.]|nr:hypothetical protein [Chryseolinea sp.]